MIRCYYKMCGFCDNHNRDLTDKTNQNRIESEPAKESKGHINTSALVTGNFCYGDWGGKWNCISF